MHRVVISDASCFILLQKIAALDILKNTYESVFTTPLIAAEVRFALPDWVTLQAPVSNRVVTGLDNTIDPGEASAIALALEMHGITVILDDLKARKTAKKLGLEVTGTVGVILKAKENGVIDGIVPYIQAIQKTNFRLSDDIVQEALRLAGETES